MNPTLKTEYGHARMDDDGYYRITSSKEGNKGKMLHRVIFESFYQISLPPHIEIHHDDENKTNNEIWNLVPMTRAEHIQIHRSSKKTLLKLNKKNTTGFYRVSKHKNNQARQGFDWRYRYMKNGKDTCISSVNLQNLKDKVIAKGLPWFKLSEVGDVQ